MSVRNGREAEADFRTKRRINHIRLFCGPLLQFAPRAARQDKGSFRRRRTNGYFGEHKRQLWEFSRGGLGPPDNPARFNSSICCEAETTLGPSLSETVSMALLNER